MRRTADSTFAAELVDERRRNLERASDSAAMSRSEAALVRRTGDFVEAAVSVDQLLLIVEELARASSGFPVYTEHQLVAVAVFLETEAVLRRADIGVTELGGYGGEIFDRASILRDAQHVPDIRRDTLQDNRGRP